MIYRIVMKDNRMILCEEVDTFTDNQMSFAEWRSCVYESVSFNDDFAIRHGLRWQGRSIYIYLTAHSMAKACLNAQIIYDAMC